MRMCWPERELTVEALWIVYSWRDLGHTVSVTLAPGNAGGRNMGPLPHVKGGERRP